MTDREGWTDLHHLAYLYAAIASGDGSVSSDELEALCDRLHRWASHLDARALMPVVMTALSACGEDRDAGDVGQLYLSVEAVSRGMDEPARKAVLDDLLGIAGADGTLERGEGELLLLIRNAWEAFRRPPS
jgi:uncharacterized tellurite resistance protein B-like protein